MEIVLLNAHPIATGPIATHPIGTFVTIYQSAFYSYAGGSGCNFPDKYEEEGVCF